MLSQIVLILIMIRASAFCKTDSIIKDLANEYIHPEDVQTAMRNNLVSQLKLQNKTLTRNELNRLKIHGTNEVVHAAKKLVSQFKNDKEEIQKKIVNFVMKLKLNDSNIEVEKAKKVAKYNKEELDKIARSGTIARNIFDKSLKKEIR